MAYLLGIYTLEVGASSLGAKNRFQNVAYTKTRLNELLRQASTRHQVLRKTFSARQEIADKELA
jgi:hypothetical protein